MKRVIMAAFAVALAAGAVAVSSYQEVGFGELKIVTEDRNPWTHLRLNNNPANFQFVMVTDRTGGHRAKVFSRAVEQINLLQPEFVLCVGDLIEGYTAKQEQLDQEWREFGDYVGKLKMPFFYVPGNHDFANATQAKDWEKRFGRSYYSFVYRDVLFLCLNSDDGPQQSRISPEQVRFVEEAVLASPNVRWTVVALHKPLWTARDLDKNGWLGVEKALGERPYTVFCGHEHDYVKFVRNGRNYYQLATTGGVSRMRGVRYGEFDHVVWITMTKDGPVLANLMLDGIYPEDLKVFASDEEGVKRTLKPTQPVKGRVAFQGQPIANAQVVFHYVDTKAKKVTRTADALTEENGTFALTTYQANDGAPAGKYVVTVTWRDPVFDEAGKLTANRLPERYAGIDTSGLRAEVTAGPNEYFFDLTK